MDLEKYGTASDIRELLAIRDSVDDILVGLQGDEVTAPRADLFDLGHVPLCSQTPDDRDPHGEQHTQHHYPSHESPPVAIAHSCPDVDAASAARAPDSRLNSP